MILTFAKAAPQMGSELESDHWPVADIFVGRRLFPKRLKLQNFPAELFRRACADETILSATKSFFAWHAELQKPPMVIRRRQLTAGKRRKGTGGR